MERDLEFLLDVVTLHLGSVTWGNPPSHEPCLMMDFLISYDGFPTFPNLL